MNPSHVPRPTVRYLNPIVVSSRVAADASNPEGFSALVTCTAVFTDFEGVRTVRPDYLLWFGRDTNSIRLGKMARWALEEILARKCCSIEH